MNLECVEKKSRSLFEFSRKQFALKSTLIGTKPQKNYVAGKLKLCSKKTKKKSQKYMTNFISNIRKNFDATTSSKYLPLNPKVLLIRRNFSCLWLLAYHNHGKNMPLKSRRNRGGIENLKKQDKEYKEIKRALNKKAKKLQDEEIIETV